LGDSITHGSVLESNHVLQYLFFLHKIGVVVSPLSDKVNLHYKIHPFAKLFFRGLKVSLATDTPLEVHSTGGDPLAEEYAVAAQMWRLSPCDLSEIARNSILNSTFPDERKADILGKNYAQSDPASNDACKTNLPNIRLAFRHETHSAELEFLSHVKITESLNDYLNEEFN